MHSFPKWLIFLGLLILGSGSVAHVGAASMEEEKAETLVKMRKVWEALMAYKKDSGQYPGELSDLVPRYLPDSDALLSPTEKRTGRHGDNGQIDAKFRTSFCYEFTSRQFNRSKLSFRELKERQMEEFGPVVPLLRCFLYDRVVNMSVSGDIFESALYWESSPEAKAVMARIGLGPGFRDGEFATLKVFESKTRNVVADAEVRVTQRQYHSLPLPERTLRTGKDGTVRVPLGPADPPSRKLTVTVLKPGFYAPAQKWEEGKLPKEASIGLDEGEVIGGIVRTVDGKPLAGAELTVLHVRPDETKESKFVETLLTSEVTNAEGKWKCERVPQGFIGIAIRVKHTAAWTSWFYSSREAGPHKVLRSALQEKSAELIMDPVASVRGTVLDADGKPVAGAEVMVKPSYPNAPHARYVGSITTSIPLDPLPVKTDAAGRYAVPWHDDAEVMIMAFPAGSAPARVKVTAAADMKEQDLRLAGGRIIKGRVSDQTGKAVSGAEVSLSMWGGYGLPAKKIIATTDDSGDFAWTTAPPEALRLVVRADGFFDLSHEVGEAAEGEATVALKLRKRN